MKKQPVLNAGFLVLLAALAVFIVSCTLTTPTACPAGCNCNANRTQGSDEFKVWNSQVSKNSSVFTCSGWNPLANNDALTTDSSGEAELNFSACWDGRLYMFKDSGGTFRARACRRADYCVAGNPNCVQPDTCLQEGTYYSQECGAEYSISTESALVEKTGSTFSVTYRSEKDQATLVVVLKGGVKVRPVLRFTQPVALGAPLEVLAAQFLFTMPDANLRRAGGLEARRAYGLEQLFPLAQDLGYGPAMNDVYRRAAAQDVLPLAWPVELVPGGSTTYLKGLRFTLRAEGGPLTDTAIQSAVLQGVNWNQYFDPGRVLVRGQPIADQPALAYNLDAASKTIRDRFRNGFSVVLYFPNVNPIFGQAAELITAELSKLGVRAAPQAIPLADMNARIQTAIQAGQTVIAIIPIIP